MWVGAALATGNWVCVAVASIAMLSAYTYRIRSEEEMLLGTSGYDEYRAHTWRLIPSIEEPCLGADGQG
jgi:protein-S-isoprenylcysteine O-methyltransferase Ste14